MLVSHDVEMSQGNAIGETHFPSDFSSVFVWVSVFERVQYSRIVCATTRTVLRVRKNEKEQGLRQREGRGREGGGERERERERERPKSRELYLHEAGASLWPSGLNGN